MKKMMMVVLLIAIMGIVGCAGSLTNYLPKDKGDNYSQVIIMRSHNPIGSAMKIDIILDRKIIAHMGLGEYFSFPLAPGDHSLMVHADIFSTPTVDYEFTPKTKYYFMVGPNWAAMINIEKIEETMALQKLKTHTEIKELEKLLQEN